MSSACFGRNPNSLTHPIATLALISAMKRVETWKPKWKSECSSPHLSWGWHCCCSTLQHRVGAQQICDEKLGSSTIMILLLEEPQQGSSVSSQCTSSRWNSWKWTIWSCLEREALGAASSYEGAGSLTTGPGCSPIGMGQSSAEGVMWLVCLPQTFPLTFFFFFF